MSVSSSSTSLLHRPPTHLIPVDPRIYCETMNELHSYLTTCKRGYLTQAELFRYYRQRHDNAEIPYRLLGYRSLLDLLSSDQRLFAIDLRREPAYVYSAVKLRQQKRERRQGTGSGTSFSRQHHSTNTIEDDQQGTPPDYIFFNHHVPLNEQQQTIDSSDEHEHEHEHEQPFLSSEIDRPSTPTNHTHFDTNVWQTPQLDKQMNYEERNEEKTLHFVPNAFLPLPTVRHSLDVNDNSSLHRRILSHCHDEDSSIVKKCSSDRLNRSISTSTTSLSKAYSFHIVDAYIFVFTVMISFIFFGIYLFKIC